MVLGKLRCMVTSSVGLGSLDDNVFEDRTPVLHFFMLPTAWRAGLWAPHCIALERVLHTKWLGFHCGSWRDVTELRCATCLQSEHVFLLSFTHIDTLQTSGHRSNRLLKFFNPLVLDSTASEEERGRRSWRGKQKERGENRENVIGK